MHKRSVVMVCESVNDFSTAVACNELKMMAVKEKINDSLAIVVELLAHDI